MLVRNVVRCLCLGVSSLYLIGCSTISVAPAMTLEDHPEAITLPYRISSAGRILLDIAVNEDEARSFVLDTGATVSAIYDSYSENIGLVATEETVLIRGLVSVGRRPVIKGVNFDIGGKPFQPERVVVLEAPRVMAESIGLLGTDILSNYIIVFNKENLITTLLPSDALQPNDFSGWRRIPLEGQTKGRSDVGLHFAETMSDNGAIPILIDTGSSSNFINWRFAKLDPRIKQLERRLRNEGHLQGALDTTPLKMDAKLFDIEVGQKYWPEIDVTVIELNQLSTIVPVDDPIMIAGANMFTASSFAFDFGGNQIFVRPNENDVERPRNRAVYVPSGITRPN